MGSDGQESPDDAVIVCRLAAALGMIDASRVDEIVGLYRRSHMTGDIGDFLLAQGLIDAEQLAVLRPRGDTTVVGVDGSPAGKVFLGCLVERKLGQGGMGSVWLARRQSIDEPVVVKFLSTQHAKNKTWRARFLREAEILRRIKHPNIVQVYAFDGDHPTPHIVMEYVQGKGLDAVLKDGELTPLEAVRICRDIARGLAEAHRNKIIHRDLKPANVLITKTGDVKVLDFGLAKSLDTEEQLSVAGNVLGTPHYMAPEQWGEHGVDTRADVYALGVTLYQLTTRVLPFNSLTSSGVSQKILAGKYAPPRSLNPNISEDLELVIGRMMHLERRFRYPTAEACQLELDNLLEGRPVDVPRLIARATGKRYPLLPQTTFLLGRDEGCEVVVLDRSISRHHARIERTSTTFMLHDLGSSYGSFVGGMRVKSVVLKDGDEIKLGKVAFEFRDGGLSSHVSATRRLEIDRLKTRTVLVPFVHALTDSADRRVVLTLLEELAPDAQSSQLAAAHEALGETLGGDVAGKVRDNLEARLARARSRSPAFLFAITHENLGEDVEAWLNWWDQARMNYPPQLVPRLAVPRARLQVLKGEPTPRTIPLDGDCFAFTLGRDETCNVPINSVSVSRHHASILRYHRRFVLRDEGSRFGTMLNGAPVRLAFLRPGDRFLLGKVEVEFQVTPPAREIGETGADLLGATLIDPEAFLVLEELRHPSIVLAERSFLEMAQAPFDWVEAETRWLFDDETRARNLFGAVKRAYERRAAKARELLTQLLGPSADETPAAWRALQEARRAELGPQVLPVGWFPKGASDTQAT